MGKRTLYVLFPMWKFPYLLRNLGLLQDEVLVRQLDPGLAQLSLVGIPLLNLIGRLLCPQRQIHIVASVLMQGLLWKVAKNAIYSPFEKEGSGGTLERCGTNGTLAVPCSSYIQI